MPKLIRCECGFVARGETAEETIQAIRGHMREDHPELLDQVSADQTSGLSG